MKLLEVIYIATTEANIRLFEGHVEGKVDELRVLEDKLHEANDMLNINVVKTTIHSAIEPVHPTKKNPDTTFRMTHAMVAVFKSASGDPIELINDIAGNIQHLID